MPLRLLGLQIANGYSPEASVFANLLAHADRTAVEPHVLHHSWAGDTASARKFQEVSGASLQTLDFGWRSMAPGQSLPAKASARLRFLAALPKALALARRVNPDVIYSCQQLWDCQAATYLARKLGKPQVIHLHYIIGSWLHPPVLARLLTCEHLVTVSNFIREEALRHGAVPEKVTTVRNSVTALPLAGPEVRREVRDELGITPDAPLLGVVARLDPDKGQADTLQAFALARRTYPEARLLIIGDPTPWQPDYAAKLMAEASALGLGGSALFLGHRSDVPRLLAALDVFVHPTRLDPCPLALLEASAAGLPVIAYAEGGANEIIQNERTGLLSAPGDVPALAESLRRLLADPALGRQMGAAGQARIEVEFRPEDSRRQFAEVLGAVLRAA